MLVFCPFSTTSIHLKHLQFSYNGSCPGFALHHVLIYIQYTVQFAADKRIPTISPSGRSVTDILYNLPLTSGRSVTYILYNLPPPSNRSVTDRLYNLPLTSGRSVTDIVHNLRSVTDILCNLRSVTDILYNLPVNK